MGQNIVNKYVIAVSPSWKTYFTVKL